MTLLEESNGFIKKLQAIQQNLKFVRVKSLALKLVHNKICILYELLALAMLLHQFASLLGSIVGLWKKLERSGAFISPYLHIMGLPVFN